MTSGADAMLAFTTIMTMVWNALDTPFDFLYNFSVLDFILAMFLGELVTTFILRVADKKFYKLSQETYDYAAHGTTDEVFSDYATNGDAMREVSSQASLEGLTEDWNLNRTDINDSTYD